MTWQEFLEFVEAHNGVTRGLYAVTKYCRVTCTLAGCECMTHRNEREILRRIGSDYDRKGVRYVVSMRGREAAIWVEPSGWKVKPRCSLETVDGVVAMREGGASMDEIKQKFGLGYDKVKSILRYAGRPDLLVYGGKAGAGGRREGLR